VSYSVPQPKTDPYTKAQESYEQKQQRLSKTFGTDTVPETVNRTTGYYGPESEAFTEDLAQDLAGALTREWRGEWDEEEPTQEEEELTVDDVFEVVQGLRQEVRKLRLMIHHMYRRVKKLEGDVR
jgi:hypothetical protein